MLTITPDFKADSPRRWAELRRRGPVHRIRLETGLEVWAVVTYEAAREALAHPLLRKDSTPAEAALAAAGFTLHKPGVGIGGNMLEADPPAHTRLRRVVAGAFSPRRVEALAPRVREIAAGLLGALAGRYEVDLVTAYHAPLPIAVIGELLGVPEEERAGFRTWTAAAVSAPSAAQREGVRALNACLESLIARKRAAPGDDLLSALAAGGELSDEELLGTAALMVVAGHDTTVNLLGNAVAALLRQPAELARLRARPELIAGAVEEFLRYDPPVEQASKRYAAEDLTLAGQPIRRGDVVAVMLGSASRDAPQTDDGDPGLLDVERAAARHLAFGHGIHHCLGAPLARLEATIALGALIERFPRLSPAVALEEIEWIASGMMRGPVALPVRLS
ncbi:cytochrome P450 [Paractinoplanes deccanensis]|uniref:Cytochrome P450 n=1 Tax=Paractinoplanes deccanensis TaxID=113561 RepID=A0ABQ3YBP2_9ACTN|nr:cytochrome P450 [Actinoplanes deccanensis]GID77436.1 cytochrome P450 [Actinoplanes deccanensis]